MNNQKVDEDVRWAVGGAVYWAVAGAVVEVVKKDSEHPAPLDFLREARL